MLRRDAEEAMYRRWDELTEERNNWQWSILDNLVPLIEESNSSQDASDDTA
jgi:hypothetical protein